MLGDEKYVQRGCNFPIHPAPPVRPAWWPASHTLTHPCFHPLTLQAKLLEHNVRFGDPECQSLMVRAQPRVHRHKCHHNRI